MDDEIKNWADLTADEKIDRLRQQVKVGDQHITDLTETINALRSELIAHRHLGDDVVSGIKVPMAEMAYDLIAVETDVDEYF